MKKEEDTEAFYDSISEGYEKTHGFVVSDKINLLDRSFISLFAHVWTVYKRGIDIREETLREFVLLLKADKIIIPTFFINVECSYALAKERFIDDKKSLSHKNTAKYLINEDYFRSVQQFNKQILCMHPSLQIDATKNIDENLKKIISLS